jgi:hypothetical protein
MKTLKVLHVQSRNCSIGIVGNKLYVAHTKAVAQAPCFLIVLDGLDEMLGVFPIGLQ